MIRNIVEDHVETAIGSLRQHFAAFCGCELCLDDVRVFALNRLSPRYVSSREGAAVTGVALSRDDQRATIDVVVLDALKTVTAAPRCGRAAGG